MKLSGIRFLFSFAFLVSLTASLSAFSEPSDRVPEIQNKVQTLQKQMKQISEIPKLMETFEPLMKEKKFKEAEAVVDLALKKLKEFKASQ